MSEKKTRMSRRIFFTRSTAATAAIAAGSLVTNADLEEVSARVNTNSQPSKLKITDLRLAHIRTPKGYGGRTVVRIDTNQGISGYSDIETGDTYTPMLKQRILGENPCNIAKIKRKIYQFAYHARQGGGVSAIDMAILDIAGKAWGVPVWQILGGKFRNKVKLYADTTFSVDSEKMGNILLERINRGYKCLKMDLNFPALLRGKKDTMGGISELGPELYSQWDFRDERKFNYTASPFTGISITEKGIRLIQEHCQILRDIAGWDIPIATDHFGHFPVETFLNIFPKLDQFNFAWFEDPVPFEYVEQYKMLRQASATPMLTGEDIFGVWGFRKLIEEKAIAFIHPDLARCGGAWEALKISELATKHGVATTFHMSGFPFRMMASIHCAAACENFTACEFHDVDNPDYGSFVTGLPKPLVDDGYVSVLDSPGLGIEANEEVMKKYLYRGEFFAPTPEWDEDPTMDRIWGYTSPKKQKLG